MKSRLAAKEVKILIREDYAWLTETYISHRGLFDNLSVPEIRCPHLKGRRKTVSP